MTHQAVEPGGSIKNTKTGSGRFKRRILKSHDDHLVLGKLLKPYALGVPSFFGLFLFRSAFSGVRAWRSFPEFTAIRFGADRQIRTRNTNRSHAASLQVNPPARFQSRR